MSNINCLCTSLVLFVSAVSLSATTVSFSTDGTMAAANWSTTKFDDSEGNANFSSSQLLSGGNPGAYWNVTHSYGPRTVTSSASIALAHLNSNFTWNPSIQGMLNNVSLSLSADVINDGASNAVGLGVVLFQNGTYYTWFMAAPSQGPSWTTYSASNGIATDFTSGLNVPDFSPSGSLINFGFYTANGTTGSATSTQTAIDNVKLVLDVTPIPEPSSLAIFSTLGASLFIRSRRRETFSC